METLTITSKEYADLNGVSVRYVNQCLSDGKILPDMVGFRKAGGTWLIQVLKSEKYFVPNLELPKE